MIRAVRKISFRLTAAELADFEQLLREPYTRTWSKLVRRALRDHFNKFLRRRNEVSDADRSPTKPPAEPLSTQELIFKKSIRKKTRKCRPADLPSATSRKAPKGGDA